MWTTVRSAKVTVLEQIDKEIMKVIHGYTDKDVNNFQRTQPGNIRVLFCFFPYLPFTSSQLLSILQRALI